MPGKICKKIDARTIPGTRDVVPDDTDGWPIFCGVDQGLK